MHEIERLPVSTPFISLTTLTTSGGGGGGGGGVQFRICFFEKWGLGNSKTFDLGNLFVCGLGVANHGSIYLLRFAEAFLENCLCNLKIEIYSSQFSPPSEIGGKLLQPIFAPN